MPPRAARSNPDEANSLETSDAVSRELAELVDRALVAHPCPEVDAEVPSPPTVTWPR